MVKLKVKKTLDNNEIFTELISKQLKEVDNTKKLQYSDLKRICKYIDISIFDENQCSIWSGYITNSNNSNKGTYINFYFRKKKAALHRLLYSNFVEELESDEYLKFNCENKGKCCNIAHLKKFKYNKKTSKQKEPFKIPQKKYRSAKVVEIFSSSSGNSNRLRVSFD